MGLLPCSLNNKSLKTSDSGHGGASTENKSNTELKMLPRSLVLLPCSLNNKSSKISDSGHGGATIKIRSNTELKSLPLSQADMPEMLVRLLKLQLMLLNSKTLD